MEVTGSRGRKRNHLLDDLKEIGGYSKLKRGSANHTLWRTHFGRGYGPIITQTTKRLNVITVCSVNFKKPMHTLSGQAAKFLIITAAGRSRILAQESSRQPLIAKSIF